LGEGRRSGKRWEGRGGQKRGREGAGRGEESRRKEGKRRRRNVPHFWGQVYASGNMFAPSNSLWDLGISIKILE